MPELGRYSVLNESTHANIYVEMHVNTIQYIFLLAKAPITMAIFQTQEISVHQPGKGQLAALKHF